MNDRFFLDANIIVYSFDNENPAKRDKARELIAGALASGKGVVSFQVIQEFLNVALGKFKTPLSMPDAREYLTSVLFPLCEVFPGHSFYLEALEIKERTGYSLYDCLILRAALEAECRTLFTEDMKDGFKFYDLTVKNPFISLSPDSG